MSVDQARAGPMAQSIRSKVETFLKPAAFLLENESHLHGGPATESHFKVTVVTDKFEGESQVKRHQRLYGLLADELKGEVHALALHLYTPAEWQERHAVPASPACRGGSAVESGRPTDAAAGPTAGDER